MLVRLFVSALFLVFAACSSDDAPVRTVVVERYSESTTKPAKAAPTLTSLAPETATAGDLVILRGSRLGGAQGASLVLVGGVPAQIDSWADSQIGLYVPAGLVAGELDVTAVVDGQSSNPLALTVNTPEPPQGGGSGFATHARLLGRVDVYGRYTQAGVVVSIGGTALTTATDINGLYFIDQIPPGTRDVTFAVPGGKHEPVTLKGMMFAAGSVERPSMVPLYYGFSLARAPASWVDIHPSSPWGVWVLEDDTGWLWGARPPETNAVRFTRPFGEFNYEYSPGLEYLLFSHCAPWFVCSEFTYVGADWEPHFLFTGGAEIVVLTPSLLLLLDGWGGGLFDMTTGELTPLNSDGVYAIENNDDYVVVQSQLGELYSVRISDQVFTTLDTGVAWSFLSPRNDVVYAKSAPGHVLSQPVGGGVTHATGVTAAAFVAFSPTGAYMIVQDELGDKIALSVTGSSTPVAITGTTWGLPFVGDTDYIVFTNLYGTFIQSAAGGAAKYLGEGASTPQRWGPAGYFFTVAGDKLYRMASLASTPELLVERVVQAEPITADLILYSTWDSELRTMPMAGGASTLLHSGVMYPVFETKDGETLFFGDGLTSATLYRVSLAGGAAQPLASNVSSFSVNSAGTRVAYRTPTAQLYAVSASGGAPLWIADSTTDFAFIDEDEVRYAYNFTLGTNPLMVKRLTDGAVARLVPETALPWEYYLGNFDVKSGSHYEHVETRLYRRP